MEIRVMKVFKSALWNAERHIVLMKIRPTLNTKWGAFFVGVPTYYVAIDMDVNSKPSDDFEELFKKFVDQNEGLVTDENLYLHECNLKELMAGTKYGELDTQIPFTFWYADLCNDEKASQRELRKIILQGVYDNVINHLYKYYLPKHAL